MGSKSSSRVCDGVGLLATYGHFWVGREGDGVDGLGGCMSLRCSGTNR